MEGAQGELVIALATAVVLTVPVCLGLLWLYRRSLRRAMHVPAQPAAQAAMPPPVQPDAVVPTRSITDAYKDAVAGMTRTAMTVVAGAFAYAVVFAVAWIFVPGAEVKPLGVLWLITVYGFPVVIAAFMALPRVWIRSVVIGGYVAMLVVIGSAALIRGPVTFGELVYFWATTNVPATVLLTAFLLPKVRAVGPLVLGFMAAGVAGGFLLVDLLLGQTESLLVVARIAALLGISGWVAFVGVHLLGFVPFAGIGLLLLNRLGRRYERGNVGSLTPAMDSMWLLFAVAQTIELMTPGLAWAVTGMVAFTAYKMTTRAAFAFLRRPPDPAPARLLLLRVFSLKSRSERLFGALAGTWLHVGSIDLIAGPDLATVTIQPNEFMSFLGGHLSDLFVNSAEDLHRRLAARSRRPDPDGRYRVSEFFCHADTWKMAVAALAGGSDVVLMDLRGFCERNQGCLYELQHLVSEVPIERVRLLVDGTTDHAFLDGTLVQFQQALVSSSPNYGRVDITSRILQLEGAGRPDLRRVLDSLTEPRMVQA